MSESIKPESTESTESKIDRLLTHVGFGEKPPVEKSQQNQENSINAEDFLNFLRKLENRSGK